MFQKNTPGEARVGARDGYNRMVSPHVRLFPHNISENPSYSLPSTIRCTIARKILQKNQETTGKLLENYLKATRKLSGKKLLTPNYLIFFNVFNLIS